MKGGLTYYPEEWQDIRSQKSIRIYEFSALTKLLLEDIEPYCWRCKEDCFDYCPLEKPLEAQGGLKFER